MAQRRNEHGEGNHKASREYDEATKRFVESGRADAAARAAKPKSASEAAELERAEAKGRERAREEDPALSPGDPQGVRVTDRPADQPSTPAPGRRRS